MAPAQWLKRPFVHIPHQASCPVAAYGIAGLGWPMTASGRGSTGPHAGPIPGSPTPRLLPAIQKPSSRREASRHALAARARARWHFCVMIGEGLQLADAEGFRPREPPKPPQRGTPHSLLPGVSVRAHALRTSAFGPEFLLLRPIATRCHRLRTAHYSGKFDNKSTPRVRTSSPVALPYAT